MGMGLALALALARRKLAKPLAHSGRPAARTPASMPDLPLSANTLRRTPNP